MKCEHLGMIVDVDPRVAAYENAVVRALRRHGPSRQKDLWYRSGAQRVGREMFQQTIDSLVDRGIIVRETTNYKNSFILRMAPDKRLRDRAAARAEKAAITKPLVPEAA